MNYDKSQSVINSALEGNVMSPLPSRRTIAFPPTSLANTTPKNTGLTKLPLNLISPDDGGKLIVEQKRRGVKRRFSARSERNRDGIDGILAAISKYTERNNDGHRHQRQRASPNVITENDNIELSRQHPGPARLHLRLTPEVYDLDRLRIPELPTLSSREERLRRCRDFEVAGAKL